VAYSPLSVRERLQDDVRVLQVAGEIDLATAPALAQALADAETESRLVLDLTDVEFLDSAGLHVLLAAARDRAAAGHRFGVISPLGSAPRRLIDLTGVADAVGLVEPEDR
jgi:anti-anti-sigma factor